MKEQTERGKRMSINNFSKRLLQIAEEDSKNNISGIVGEPEDWPEVYSIFVIGVPSELFFRHRQQADITMKNMSLILRGPERSQDSYVGVSIGADIDLKYLFSKKEEIEYGDTGLIVWEGVSYEIPLGGIRYYGERHYAMPWVSFCRGEARRPI